MSIREKINENQNLVVVVAVVIIVVAVLFMVMRGGGGGGPSGPGTAYYMDTVTNEVFTDDAALFPPIDHNGNPAVRVHYFSCGDCDDKDKRFIGFYEKYTPEAKNQLESASQDEMMMEMYEMGVLYSIDGKTWHDPASEAYQNGLQQKLNCPDGSRARYCRAK